MSSFYYNSTTTFAYNNLPLWNIPQQNNNINLYNPNANQQPNPLFFANNLTTPQYYNPVASNINNTLVNVPMPTITGNNTGGMNLLLLLVLLKSLFNGQQSKTDKKDSKKPKELDDVEVEVLQNTKNLDVSKDSKGKRRAYRVEANESGEYSVNVKKDSLNSKVTYASKEGTANTYRIGGEDKGGTKKGAHKLDGNETQIIIQDFDKDDKVVLEGLKGEWELVEEKATTDKEKEKQNRTVKYYNFRTDTVVIIKSRYSSDVDRNAIIERTELPTKGVEVATPQAPKIETPAPMTITISKEYYIETYGKALKDTKLKAEDYLYLVDKGITGNDISKIVKACKGKNLAPAVYISKLENKSADEIVSEINKVGALHKDYGEAAQASQNAQDNQKLYQAEQERTRIVDFCKENGIQDTAEQQKYVDMLKNGTTSMDQLLIKIACKGTGFNEQDFLKEMQENNYAIDEELSIIKNKKIQVVTDMCSNIARESNGAIILNSAGYVSMMYNTYHPENNITLEEVIEKIEA
ncbi:MAG: hypothetical protein GX568_00465, partial [Candidatus Gastranaerophilales bacterium]|nr:hypothetical protein [Candidatus Gastranaerophilales bacterium]